MRFWFLVLFTGLFLLPGTDVFAHPTDSIGVEKQGDKWLIFHKVDKGETVFSIARKYKAEVAAIRNTNPTIVSAGLKIGEVIKVPVVRSDKEKTKAKTIPDAKGPKTHTVSAGQSLYGISRMYKISADDLKKWNKLEAGTVKLGQVLVLENPEKGKETGNQIPIVTVPKEVQDKDGPLIETEPAGVERIVEKGIAELIAEGNETQKHLCLHKTAPLNSIVRIKSDVTGAVVFVRVIGKLPDTGQNEQVLVRLTRKPFEKISAGDKRVPVESSYNK